MLATTLSFTYFNLLIEAVANAKQSSTSRATLPNWADWSCLSAKVDAENTSRGWWIFSTAGCSHTTTEHRPHVLISLSLPLRARSAEYGKISIEDEGAVGQGQRPFTLENTFRSEFRASERFAWFADTRVL
jgi:hypothetical protein